MKKILKHLFDHKPLSRIVARDTLVNTGMGMYNEHEVTAFMTVYLMRSITIEELQGFRDALINLAVTTDLETFKGLDIVGTGGDGKNTFNISTLACFVVAGAGQHVTKHGNYGASSVSGSSNVMEMLGYKFSTDNGKLKSELEKTNICFLHAPLFHPVLKNVAQIRKNLAMRTFFNMLGPLANPANPSYQLIGVYSPEMARIYNYYLQETGKQFTIVHSLDGYDEISLTGDTKVITQNGEKVMTPEQLGKRMVSAEDITGGNTIEDATKIFLKIIRGEGTWAQNAVVLANAAMALDATGKYPDYESSYNAAVESLESGKANSRLQQLIEMQTAVS